MVLRVETKYRLHLFIFLLLSLYLFFLMPIPFVHRFLAAAICLGVLLHLKKIEFKFNRWYEIALFILVNAYLTFAFFGYDLFLAPRPELFLNTFYMDFSDYMHMLDMAGPYFGLLLFGLGFIWTGYVLQSFLDIIKKVGDLKDRFSVRSEGGYWRKWVILFGIMFVVFLIWQVAFNPILMTPDSWRFIAGWRFGRYVTSFSPVYTFLVNIVLSVAPTRPEVLWIGIAQNLAFSALLSTILMYFHKRWIKFKYVILAAVVLPLIPSFGLYPIIIWVDLTNGMTILWLTYALVRIFDEVIINKTASKKQLISFCIQLCLSLALAFFIRSNSFPVYIIMAPILTLLFILKKQWILFTSVAVSLILVLLIRFPGYNALDVQRTRFTDEARFFAAIHDMQATYYRGGSFSEQTLNSLRKYVTRLDDPEVIPLFRPDWVQSGAFGYNLREITMNEFLSMYFDALINNPFEMIRSMLYRVRAYWVIDSKSMINTPTGQFLIERPPDRVFSDIGVERQPNILTNLMDAYVTATRLPFPAIFIWRFGIYTALMVVSMMTLILQKRYIWLLAYLPVFVYLATLFLAGSWNVHRYGLPVFFVGLFLPAAHLLLKPPLPPPGEEADSS